jgi:reactive intermediate/imine deaminase
MVGIPAPGTIFRFIINVFKTQYLIMQKHIISTDKAPQAIGTYSQAVCVTGGSTIYLSGQIPLVPETMEMIEGDIAEQIIQVFKNLTAVCKESGGGLNNIVKLNVYLTDLNNFPIVNEIMATYFDEPFPARAAVGINELPKGAMVEMDGIMVIKEGDYTY